MNQSISKRSTHRLTHLFHLFSSFFRSGIERDLDCTASFRHTVFPTPRQYSTCPSSAATPRRSTDWPRRSSLCRGTRTSTSPRQRTTSSGCCTIRASSGGKPKRLLHQMLCQMLTMMLSPLQVLHSEHRFSGNTCGIALREAGGRPRELRQRHVHRHTAERPR